jgi:predicted dehydrogenase
LAGGALYDIGVYNIEVMSYLIGKEIRGVKSNFLYADTGVDAVDNITLLFDGCIANLQSSIAHHVPTCAYFYGSGGYIKIPDFHVGNDCFLYPDNKPAEEFRGEPVNGFVYQIREVIDCVRSGKLESDVMPHRDTVRCTEIFDYCLRGAALQL